MPAFAGMTDSGGGPGRKARRRPGVIGEAMLRMDGGEAMLRTDGGEAMLCMDGRGPDTFEI